MVINHEIELPTNKKFGMFFAAIFGLAAAFFYFEDAYKWAYGFATASVTFLALVGIYDKALLPLNKLWMRFGLVLGTIVSPIVLGLLFFGLFTPIGIFMRTFGRDELGIKLQKKPSYWIPRNDASYSGSFEQQF